MNASLGLELGMYQLFVEEILLLFFPNRKLNNK